MTGVFVAAIVLWLGSGIMPAQPKAEPPAAKVAVVDVSKVFTEYQRSKDFNDELKKRQDEIEGELKQIRDRIEAIKGELENFDPNSKDYSQREEQMVSLTINFEATKRVRVERTGKEMLDVTEHIYSEILKAVETIAAETGYDLVIYRDATDIKSDKLADMREKILQRKVLYAKPQIDLTDQVLQHMNQAYKLGQAQGKK